MTWFINFRQADRAGDIRPDPLIQTTPTNAPDTDILDTSNISALTEAVSGKNVLVYCHGFNVSGPRGVTSAARLEAHMRRANAPFRLPDNTALVAILWPGDWYTPFNYPFEARDAIDVGNKLAKLIIESMRPAVSFSFASHSLGARVVLQAAAQIDEPRLKYLILTAAAADNNCLVRQHAAAYEKAKRVFVLYSRRDNTLKWAYPAGDAISDIFVDDNDSPFGGALGRTGPRQDDITKITQQRIPDSPHNPRNGPLERLSDFDHCVYFPDWKVRPPDKNIPKSLAVADFIGSAMAGNEAAWWQ